MAKKSKGVTPVQHFPAVPSFRWVKKAGLWCKTWFENGKQHQQWLTKDEYVGLGARSSGSAGQHKNTDESVGGK